MTTKTPGPSARQVRALAWIVGLAMVGLVFDGYDLAVYGTVVSTLLRDPSQLGPMTPALAGALLAGAVGDLIGRRKLMLASYAWFAVGMGATAMAHDPTVFGLLRFATGLVIGALPGTTAALISE